MALSPEVQKPLNWGDDREGRSDYVYTNREDYAIQYYNGEPPRLEVQIPITCNAEGHVLAEKLRSVIANHFEGEA